MLKKKKLVVANWKLQPETAGAAKIIFSKIKKGVRGLKNTAVVVCPPFPFLPLLKAEGEKNLALGAQDVFSEESGAFTGEVGAGMIKSVGGSYAIVGHSERRILGDSDEIVAQKLSAALRSHLSAILCVGESKRDQGGAYLGFIEGQIKRALQNTPHRLLSSLIIAYEPVWKIGQSFKDAMRPEEVHETSLFIKKVLSGISSKEEAFKVPVLYGGSVNGENAALIVGGGEVNGLLVGRESLAPERFNEILKTVDGLRL